MMQPSQPAELSWWRNGAQSMDQEMIEIDRIYHALKHPSPEILKIRNLITSLELCHHKAPRWIENILASIGTGRADKGLGSNVLNHQHSKVMIWQDVCHLLSEWTTGNAPSFLNLKSGNFPLKELLSSLGSPTELKRWQVQRVIDKIQSVIPAGPDKSQPRYEWLLISGNDYELGYRSDCPEAYKDHEDFWLTTVKTQIHDLHQGKESKLSLGLAIDMLWPCHWNFPTNLKNILGAIGGHLTLSTPFAACGRNIQLVPEQKRLKIICATLQTFSGRKLPSETDQTILDQLGEPTSEKCWLSLSLAKTIHLQLNPPSDMLEATSLEGPEWTST